MQIFDSAAMHPYQIFTIVPECMTLQEMADLARERGCIITSNGRTILLAPRVMPGFRRLYIEGFATRVF